MYIGECLRVCMCITCESDMVDAGNPTWVHWKSRK